MYTVALTPEAEKNLALLKKCEPMAYKKAVKLIDELLEHPYTGTGKPKPLGGNRTGQWSRRITDKHRLIYVVEDNTLIVFIVSAASHYGEK